MDLLDANDSLTSEELESFQRQVVNHLHVLAHLLPKTDLQGAKD
jgi:hypothetical protein